MMALFIIVEQAFLARMTTSIILIILFRAEMTFIVIIVLIIFRAEMT